MSKTAERVRAGYYEPKMPLPDLPQRTREREILEREVKIVRNAESGERNARLHASAVTLGQLVAGEAIHPFTVRSHLFVAAIDIGLSEDEAITVIEDGLNRGAENPICIDALVRETFEAEMADYHEKLRERDAERHRLAKQFRVDLEAEFEMTGHPKAQKVWERAADVAEYGDMLGACAAVADDYEAIIELMRD